MSHNSSVKIGSLLRSEAVTVVSSEALSFLIPLGGVFILAVLGCPISWGSGPSCWTHRTRDVLEVHAWLCKQQLPCAAGRLSGQLGAIEI